MSNIVTKKGKCPKDGPVMIQKVKLNHILHLILTLATLSLWGWVWLFLAFKNYFAPYRCTKCGIEVNPIS